MRPSKRVLKVREQGNREPVIPDRIFYKISLSRFVTEDSPICGVLKELKKPCKTSPPKGAEHDDISFLVFWATIAPQQRDKAAGDGKTPQGASSYFGLIERSMWKRRISSLILFVFACLVFENSLEQRLCHHGRSKRDEWWAPLSFSWGLPFEELRLLIRNLLFPLLTLGAIMSLCVYHVLFFTLYIIF